MHVISVNDMPQTIETDDEPHYSHRVSIVTGGILFCIAQIGSLRAVTNIVGKANQCYFPALFFFSLLSLSNLSCIGQLSCTGNFYFH
mmetsp:Transcript_33324/g.76934  ORF Transcript_33324/g.76934 Transcript_33324/m.76934 type:complete len:87 (+) Transcript_33324:137-397(+)